MGVQIDESAGLLRITLSGLDRLTNWRRVVDIPFDLVTGASVATRASVEALVDHRLLGRGTHFGSRRAGGHRVGQMMGRGTAGKHF